MRTLGQRNGKCKDPIIKSPNFPDEKTEIAKGGVTSQRLTEPGLEFYLPDSHALKFPRPIPELARLFKVLLNVEERNAHPQTG